MDRMDTAEAGSSNSSSDTEGKRAWKFAKVRELGAVESKLLELVMKSHKKCRRQRDMKLRRRLTPKNALTVLREMVPRKQLANQFKTSYEPLSSTSFRSDLTLGGKTYQGYGTNKAKARTAVAEMAIRDIYIKRMSETVSGTGASGAGAGASGAGAGASGSQDGDAVQDSLPMIQVANFALHKLFSEWEICGYKVPQFNRPNTSVSESKNLNKNLNKFLDKKLPLNAPQLHPCVLLNHMRPMPRLDFRLLDKQGDSPQNTQSTVGVNVDGHDYIGTATNEKEARKLAARSACEAVFGVQFDEVPTDNVPQF